MLATLRWAAACAVLVASLVAGPATAEPIPSGALGVTLGAASGTGADAKRIGYGVLLGGFAAWQPMTTEQRFGWSVKWSVTSGKMYYASAARLTDPLLTLQMDMLAGIRMRPGVSPERYLSLRAGPALLRANQLIPPQMQRAFIGGVVSIGLEQYLSKWLLNVDLRFSQVADGPAAVGLVIGFAKTGP